MCDVCGYSRCPSGCPNAPDPRKVYDCAWCGEEIVEGDNYFDLNGEKYHDECFEEAAFDILKEQATHGIAEVDDE